MGTLVTVPLVLANQGIQVSVVYPDTQDFADCPVIRDFAGYQDTPATVDSQDTVGSAG